MLITLGYGPVKKHETTGYKCPNSLGDVSFVHFFMGVLFIQMQLLSGIILWHDFFLVWVSQ